MKLKDKGRVLVTGASGFVGRKLCDYLSCKGYIVDGLVRKPIEMASENLTHYVYGDLGKIHEIKELSSRKYQYIFHLAWDGVSYEQKNNFDLQFSNLKVNRVMLDFLEKKMVDKIIVLGSASEYDMTEREIDGNRFPMPSDMYGCAKSASRILIEHMCRKKNISMNYIIVASIYGEGRDDNNIISYTIKKLLNKEEPQYTKLEQIWNYIYIDDLVRGIIAVAEKGKSNTVYTIGDSINRPLIDYIEEIHRKISVDINLGIGKVPYKSSKVDNLIMNTEKVYRDTGFQSKVSFGEGIEKTIDYFRNKLMER